MKIWQTIYGILFFVILCTNLYAQNWEKVNETSEINKQNIEFVKHLMDQPDSLEEISRNSGFVTDCFMTKLQDSNYRKKIEMHILKYFQNEFVLVYFAYGVDVQQRKELMNHHYIVFKNENANEFIMFQFINQNERCKLFHIYVKLPIEGM